MLIQVLERGPRHDLQKIAVEWGRKAVGRHGRGARRMYVIQIHPCSHDVAKLGEGSSPFGKTALVRR